MSEATIQAAVITVSDRSFRGERQDLSGPALVNRLRNAGQAVTVTAIVPDERGEIAAKLRDIADQKQAQVIFTTGGTGVAPRDVTPEATRDVIDREIPGIAELMRHSRAPIHPLFASLPCSCRKPGNRPDHQSTGLSQRRCRFARCYFGFGPARASPVERPRRSQ